jgi:hypothetical protein
MKGLCPNCGQKLPASPSSSPSLIGLRLNFCSQLGCYVKIKDLFSCKSELLIIALRTMTTPYGYKVT